MKSRKQLRAMVVALRPAVADAPRGASARNRRLPISCAKARRFWCKLPKSQSPRKADGLRHAVDDRAVDRGGAADAAALEHGDERAPLGDLRPEVAPLRLEAAVEIAPQRRGGDA